MVKYECHGCWKIYDDEEGMPVKCCGKTIRHKVEEPPSDIEVDDLQSALIRLKEVGDNFPITEIRWKIDDFVEEIEGMVLNLKVEQ